VSTTTAPAPGAPAAAPTPRRRGPGSGLLLLIGLVLALAAITSGTLTVVGLWWLRSDTTTTDLGAASTLRVRQSCGNVTVREAAVDRIVLTSKRWMTLTKPTVTTGRSGDTMNVTARCPSFTLGGFSGSVSLTLVVPRGTSIDANASAGSINLTSVSGTITAHSSAGSVQGEDLRSATVNASSSAGSVHLSFSSAPTTVDVSSSAGSVSVEVPDDGTAYAVDAHASAGSTHVGIATDPNSARRISAQSSAGSVSIQWR
jgi:hypothetical protein